MKRRRKEKNQCFQNPWAFDSVHRGLVWGHLSRLVFVGFNNLFVNH